MIRPDRSFLVVIVLALVGAQLTFSVVAQAAPDEAAVLDSVTKLNKRALEEYDNLSFDVARRTLEEALDLCSKNGLDNHPAKARTYVHMGVVILASGAANRDEAIKNFQKALAIQPEIKPSERLANPDTQSAFNEAKGSKPAPVAGKTPKSEKLGGAAGPAQASGAAGRPVAAAAGPPPSPTPGLAHNAIGSGVRGTVIPISVTTESSLAAKKVALWYRPAGVGKFVSLDLREYSAGNWSGSIPDSATAGEDVAYFINAQNEAGEEVGSYGAATGPIVIQLKAPIAAPAKRVEIEESPEDAEPTAPRGERTWYLGLAAGSGIGWATGKGDVNHTDDVKSAFGLSQLGHVLPEVGLFVDPNLILSLQLRLQLVSGATSVPDPSRMMCGANGICEPASGAVAALARITWLLGEGTFVPYVSGVVGAGHIRHLAKFPSSISCSTPPAPAKECVDTVAAGPILLGPGAGFILRATDNFGLTLGIATLVGFPQFTFHVDLNAGVVVEL